MNAPEWLKKLLLVYIPPTGPEPTAGYFAGVKKFLATAVGVLTLITSVLTAVLAAWPKAIITVETVKEVEVKRADLPQLVLTAGWIKDPEEVERVRSVNGLPNFGDTPAGKAALATDGDVYLWDAAKEVTGDVLPARNQLQVGSCVSFGTAAAVEHLICVQIVEAKRASRPPPEFKALCQEVIYGGSRVEIGGGRISGDGSVGAWAAQFIAQYGVVPREKIEGYDLTAYSETLCRQFGRSGVPAKLEAVAKQSPVKGTALVSSAAEAEKAIRQGYPLAVCSDQGFTYQRDRDGFCNPSGMWNHCMAIVGVKGGSRPGFFVLNSWGPTAHTGPRFPADAPVGGFWADRAVVERMLKQGDSWAFSDAVGFPSRELDYFIRAEPKPPTAFASAP